MPTLEESVMLNLDLVEKSEFGNINTARNSLKKVLMEEFTLKNLTPSTSYVVTLSFEQKILDNNQVRIQAYLNYTPEYEFKKKDESVFDINRAISLILGKSSEQIFRIDNSTGDYLECYCNISRTVPASRVFFQTYGKSNILESKDDIIIMEEMYLLDLSVMIGECSECGSVYYKF